MKDAKTVNRAKEFIQKASNISEEAVKEDSHGFTLEEGFWGRGEVLLEENNKSICIISSLYSN